MLNFRITKCIVNGCIAKCAILEDKLISKRKRRRDVQKNENCKEYFTLPNMKDSRISKSYSNRIGEAVEEVINGNGDVICYTDILNIEHIQVLYFLNRDYGNFLKEKSIEGWKNVKIKWVISKGSIGLFKEFVSYNNEYTTRQPDAMMFDSEEECLEFITDMYNNVYKILNKSNSIEDVEYLIRNKYNNIDPFNTPIFDIIFNISIEDENGYLSLDPLKNKVDNFGNGIFKIEQIVYK